MSETFGQTELAYASVAWGKEEEAIADVVWVQMAALPSDPRSPNKIAFASPSSLRQMRAPSYPWSCAFRAVFST